MVSVSLVYFVYVWVAPLRFKVWLTTPRLSFYFWRDFANQPKGLLHVHCKSRLWLENFCYSDVDSYRWVNGHGSEPLDSLVQFCWESEFLKKRVISLDPPSMRYRFASANGVYENALMKLPCYNEFSCLGST
jgi:hypothetical protein